MVLAGDSSSVPIVSGVPFRDLGALITFFRNRRLATTAIGAAQRALQIDEILAALEVAMAATSMDEDNKKALRNGAVGFSAGLTAGAAIGGPWGAFIGCLCGAVIGACTGFVNQERVEFRHNFQRVIQRLPVGARYVMWSHFRAFANRIRTNANLPVKSKWEFISSAGEIANRFVPGSEQFGGPEFLFRWMVEDLLALPCMPYEPDVNPADPFTALHPLARYTLGIMVSEETDPIVPIQRVELIRHTGRPALALAGDWHVLQPWLYDWCTRNGATTVGQIRADLISPAKSYQRPMPDITVQFSDIKVQQVVSEAVAILSRPVA